MKNPREAGDPLPPMLVRDLRVKHSLSQDQLAQRLGVKGGKSVVSAWESGRAPCEGPAAELLLRLFAGNDATMKIAQLLGEAERTWRRAGTHIDSWRQLSAVPEMPAEIDRVAFASLFPGVEIPDDEHSYGFPPTAVGLSSRAYGIGPDGWVGAIPVEPERAPRWIWAVGRGGDFYYREVPWEDEPAASTKGHMHVGSILEIALCAVFFLRRLAERCAFPGSLPYTLQFDAEGVSGRGLVAYRPIPASQRLRGFHLVDEPRTLSSDSHVSVSVRATVAEMHADPVGVVYGLVGELGLILRPDLVDPKKLADQLRRRREQDQESPGRPLLGFLDAVLGRLP